MAKIRYITMGSAAYDPNSVEAYYTYSPEIELPREAEQERPQRRAKQKPKHKAKAKLSQVVMTMAVFTAVGLLILNLLSYAMLLEISEATSDAQTRYAELCEENTKLLVKYDQTFNMNEIEAYAINVLGMTRPASGQQVKVQAVTNDKIVVHSEKNTESAGFVTEMASFITGLLSYFR